MEGRGCAGQGLRGQDAAGLRPRPPAPGPALGSALGSAAALPWPRLSLGSATTTAASRQLPKGHLPCLPAPRRGRACVAVAAVEATGTAHGAHSRPVPIGLPAPVGSGGRGAPPVPAGPASRPWLPVPPRVRQCDAASRRKCGSASRRFADTHAGHSLHRLGQSPKSKCFFCFVIRPGGTSIIRSLRMEHCHGPEVVMSQASQVNCKCFLSFLNVYSVYYLCFRCFYDSFTPVLSVFIIVSVLSPSLYVHYVFKKKLRLCCVL